LLGSRIIASDIATNRELSFGRMRFFQADSAAALTDAMQSVLTEIDASGAAVAAAPDNADGAPFDDPSRQLLEMASGLLLLSTLRTAAET
jgi:hypothetical protein